MQDEMVSYLLIFSTAGLEKAVSTGTDDPEHTQTTISPLFVPPGQYRVVAGKLLRVHEGLPESDRPPIETQAGSYPP